MQSRMRLTSRRGAANKGLIVVLAVLIVAAGAFWLWPDGNPKSQAPGLPPEERFVQLVNVNTGEHVMDVSLADLEAMACENDLYKDPKTGDFSLVVMKKKGTSVMTPP